LPQSTSFTGPVSWREVIQSLILIFK
jgi:hypothetical protein